MQSKRNWLEKLQFDEAIKCFQSTLLFELYNSNDSNGNDAI